MKVARTIAEVREQVKAWKREGCTVGLVPTMGFLHEGHASLIEACRKEIQIGAAAQYTIMPLGAWLLSVLLHLEPDLALGVILVGCCPGGTASNVITYIAGGDVALSVRMTIVSTLLAPIMTPVLVYGLAGAWVEVSLWAMVVSVVKVVLIPVLLGILLHQLFGRQIQKIQEGLPLISVTAIAIEVGMQNSGLAVSLAAANFAANPLATLPGAIFSVWHNIAGSIFAGIRRRYAEAEPGKQDLAEDF